MDIQTAQIHFINDGILAGKSPSTLKGYQYTISNLHKYIKQQFLSQQISSLTDEVIGKYMISGVKINKWNKYTLWTIYKNLNVFCLWLVKKEYLKENPLQLIPKPKMPQQQPKSLNEKEILQVLNIVSNLPTKYPFYTIRNKALICMLIYTGLRKSEILNLKLTDVDIVNGFIQVEMGKGGKRREIPIEQSTLKPILEQYVEYRNRLGRVSEWFFNGVFSNRGNNDNKLTSNVIRDLFKIISQKVNKRVYAHKLRHSFATMFLDKTGDIYLLKELLGHSDIKTTCIYLSTTRQKKVEAIGKLQIGMSS